MSAHLRGFCHLFWDNINISLLLKIINGVSWTAKTMASPFNTDFLTNSTMFLNERRIASVIQVYNTCFFGLFCFVLFCFVFGLIDLAGSVHPFYCLPLIIPLSPKHRNGHLLALNHFILYIKLDLREFYSNSFNRQHWRLLMMGCFSICWFTEY